MDIHEWRLALEEWQIPPSLVESVPESPWVLPEEVFVRRADRQIAQPGGVSHEKAREALGDGGTVLDIGAGAGAGSLPLAPAITHLTAVDGSAALLSALGERAAERGVPHTLIQNMWPAAVEEAPVADVVICNHVIYNAPDIEPFVTALTAHARRQVVAEFTIRHPLTALNPLWASFHGLTRPEGPSAEDAAEVMRSLGLDVKTEHWTRPEAAEYASFETLVDVTRRRLCLPASRADEVAGALRDLGVSEETPPDLGSSGCELVTLTWPGTATP